MNFGITMGRYGVMRTSYGSKGTRYGQLNLSLFSLVLLLLMRLKFCTEFVRDHFSIKTSSIFI